MIQCIDAHLHLWKYSVSEYGWISEEMQVLRRDYLPPELWSEMKIAAVKGAIAVQARQTIEETRWLLALASQHAFLAGVVGWAPITSTEFPRQLGSLVAHSKLKGLRHVLQDEPDDTYMLSGEFQRGISALGSTELVYEILINEHQLPYATKLVCRHPNQIFILDHLAKPKIRTAELSPWRERLRALAEHRNVYCKLSGMVTEADWEHWTADDLRPYAEIALQCFGTSRLIAGSDWPVCTLASSYGKWWSVLRELISGLSDAEQECVLAGNASRVYRLEGDSL